MQLLSNGFAEFDVALRHVRRDVGLLEERQESGRSERHAVSASAARQLVQRCSILRSMLTNEFKRASMSRMDRLLFHGPVAWIIFARDTRPIRRLTGLSSMQHNIDTNSIERKDNQAVFRLLQNTSV
jgi:hypothetical protein